MYYSSDQLLPNFSSKQFNVGLDETFDLGAGRSNKLCLENGTENVYVEFLQKVYELVKSKGYRYSFSSNAYCIHMHL